MSHPVYRSNDGMTDEHEVQLGDVQQTLFIPLAARAREARKRKPLLRDPMAVRIIDSVRYDTKTYGSGWGGRVTVLRTMIFDSWVRAFLTEHPQGTVVELGCGLNTRFERVDNGTVRWVDVDLPDTVALRGEFFDDTDRRTTVAASLLDEDWWQVVADRPGPYCFVAEGVLVYLAQDDVERTLRGLATRFPGALIAFDTYRNAMVANQHRIAERRHMPARWAWGVDDPTSLGRLGLDVVESATVTRPSPAVRDQLPLGQRIMLSVLDGPVGGFANLTLFRAGSR